MGIYVFNADFLYDELVDDAMNEKSTHDFGHDLIPRLIASGGRVYAHSLRDSCTQLNEGEPYWRDVGTIDAFWEANLELTRVTPALNLYDESWPIWTYQEQLPPAKFVFDLEGRRGAAVDSMVSGGCIVSGSTVRNSLLFSSVRVHSYCTINESVLLPKSRSAAARSCRNAWWTRAADPGGPRRGHRSRGGPQALPRHRQGLSRSSRPPCSDKTCATFTDAVSEAGRPWGC
jgi:ADP-glucose pyrophosphorylase